MIKYNLKPDSVSTELFLFKYAAISANVAFADRRYEEPEKYCFLCTTTLPELLTFWGILDPGRLSLLLT